MAVRTKTSFLSILILLAAVALWIADISRQAAPTAPEPAGTSGKYESFRNCSLVKDRGNDGDSFRVMFPDDRTETIRLLFVDAPESAFRSYGGGQNNHKRIAQQAADLGGITSQQAVELGKQAKAFTLSLLGAAPFTIHTEWEDPFGDRRYRAFVEITRNGEKRFLHELLIEKGLARIHTKGAPLLADDRLYALCEDGWMLLPEAGDKQFHQRGRFRLAEAKRDAWAHPVVHDGRLYLRYHEKLTCFDVRAAGTQ